MTESTYIIYVDWNLKEKLADQNPKTVVLFIMSTQASDLEIASTSSEGSSSKSGTGDRTKSVKGLHSYLVMMITFFDLDKSLGFWSFVTAYMVVILLHPLHYYAYVINDQQQCLEIDNQLYGTFAIVAFFNTFMLLYVPNVIRKFFKSEEKKYYKLIQHFLFTQIPVLLMTLTILPDLTTGTTNKIFLTTTNLFLFGYMLLVIGLSLTTKHYASAADNSHTIAQAKWAKAVFNLFLYLHGGHVFGAVWYCFAIDRIKACWRETYFSQNGVNPLSFVCGDEDFKPLSCPKIAQAHKNTLVFGIFNDAVQSGIVDMKSFLKKYLYCLRWGLQALSCFGQNLQPSTFPLENIYVISVTIYSTVLFVFLIGNMQAYLQPDTQTPKKTKEKEKPSMSVKKQEVLPSVSVKKQEVEPSMFLQKEEEEQSMLLQKTDAEKWMSFGKLSERLQKEVKNFLLSSWVDTSLFNIIPKDLITKIKIELCLAQLKKVKEFQQWSDTRLEDLCDCVKPAFYVERTLIVREGDPIAEMVFVLQGTVWTYTSRDTGHSNRKKDHMEDGDFFGEELVTWVQADPNTSSFPVSTRTIQALTNVEAFVLKAYDLKRIFIKYYQKQAEAWIIPK